MLAENQITLEIVNDGNEGSTIWTTTTAPTTPNYTFTISNLNGPTGFSPKVGDIILYSYYRYTITTISTTTVQAGSRVSIRGASGASSKWYTGTGITGTSTTATIFSGSGVSSAVVGDMYLNTETSNTYRCTTAGAPSAAKWVYVSNIQGEQGEKGEQGETGSQGPKGDKGDKGDQGYTPYVQNGYWYINGTSTGVKAEGEDGNTPYIQGGYWYINGTSTGIKAQGTDGVSITSVKPQYYLSTSSSSATGGSWSDTPQTFVDGRYYWTRDYITYSNGTNNTSTPVYNAGMTQASQDALDANTQAENTAQYFWFNSVDSGAGEGAGAHITQTPQANFIADVDNGGGNTFIDSEGMSIRDGISELAHFGKDGAYINKNDDGNLLECFRIAPASSVKRIETKETRTCTFSSSSVSDHITRTWKLTGQPYSPQSINISFTVKKGSSIGSGDTYFTYGTAGTKTKSANNQTIVFVYDGDVTFEVSYYATAGWKLTCEFEYDVSTTMPSYDIGTRQVGSTRGGFSAVIGEGLIADAEDNVVVGKYNDGTLQGQFSVGVGSSDTNRKTGFRVNNGWVWSFLRSGISEDLYVEEYVNAVKQYRVGGAVLGSYMVIEGDDGATMSLSTDWKYPTMRSINAEGGNAFYNAEYANQLGLTAETNGIYCKYDGLLLVQGTARYTSGFTANDTLYVVVENVTQSETGYIHRWRTPQAAPNTTQTTPISLLRVSEGDILKLKVRNSTGSRGSIDNAVCKLLALYIGTKTLV